jgi:hypothetical protein
MPTFVLHSVGELGEELHQLSTSLGLPLVETNSTLSYCESPIPSLGSMPTEKV